MQILENGRTAPVEVYGIYWVEREGRSHRMSLVVLEVGYPGLVTIAEEECTLVENAIEGFSIVKNDVGRDMVLHSVLSDLDLLERLIDHQPGAMEEFRRKLAEFSA